MKIDCLEIAEKYFCPTERDELKRLPENTMKKKFFEMWTLKEAYMKARGLGLDLPPERSAQSSAMLLSRFRDALQSFF